jgi:Kelch motif
MPTPSDTATPTLACETHGEPTRISCVECGTPVCPKCMVRTEVGTKCEKCAKSVAPRVVLATSRSRVPWVIGVVGAVIVVGAIVALNLRGGGSSKPTPPPAVLGSWAKGPSLTSIRGTTAVVQLRNGQVLAAGGGVGAVPVSAAELYDPASQSWKPTGALNEARRGANAVVLADGRVLIAGGIAGPTLLSSAEIYDPGTGRWTTTGSMAIARLDPTMTMLPGGDVLVAGGTTTGGQQGTGGGQTISPTSSAEVFHAATGQWSATKPMTDARFEATATVLTDGRVLIVGGFGGAGTNSPTGLQYPALKSAEIFDPAVGAFTGAGSMSEGRAWQVATRLADGSVLVAGGLGGGTGSGTLSTAERFQPTTAAWTEVAPMAQGRSGASASALTSGMVMVTGGETVDQGTRHSLATAQVYDPAKNLWHPAGSMSCPRSGAGTALLADGSVLVIAGDTALPGQSPVAQGCVDRFIP